MKNNFFAAIALILCLLASTTSSAAHLIGGDLSYTCQGNNLYSVKLRVYRDCAGGGAAFDAFARVAIYDTANNLIAQLSMARGPISSVSNRLVNNPCITVPASLCVEFTEYEDTISLPPIAGGYVLVHQRCCRNANITNVNGANRYGNTYNISIPSMDTTCNNAVQFNGDIDLLSCVNFPVEIPIQFTELDGDSVSFDLCEIYDGGGRGGGTGCNAVIPNPPCPPPFSTVPFVSGNSASYPIPSNPAFTVDSATGTISGTPTQIGNYVIGVCATEWRNGKIMSTTRLDYQLAVTSCTKNVVSDMVTPQERPLMICDGLTVQFESESVNASTLLWNFGDTTTTADTAVSATPTYTFPKAGTYAVQLIANPRLQCSDTTVAMFKLNPPVNPDFFYDGTLCFAAQSVDFKPIGFYVSGSTFEWDFGGDALIASSTQREPLDVKWASPGLKPVGMEVTWGPGCTASFQDTIEINRYQVPVDAGKDTTILRGDKAYLRANRGQTFYWYSDKAVTMNSRFSKEVQAELRVEDDTATFYVITTDIHGCEGLDSVKVFVNPGEAPPVDNMITPNGDGFNEVFDLSDINPSGNCKLTIMNRWGSQVYRVEPYKNDWNGHDQEGNPLPEGTYYYILQCGFKVVSTGPITIVRG